MRFNSQLRQQGGGIAGFFRPIIKFFKNVLFPGAKHLAKRAVTSKVGKQSVRALKKAAVNITADTISGGVTGKDPATHIDKARGEIADALRHTQNKNKKKKKAKSKKKIMVRKKIGSTFF